jgi:hypothetical protein
MQIIRKKWGIVFKATIFVVPLMVLKFLIDYFNWDLIAVGPVVTALVAGVMFLLAILLTGVLSDYKESEKIPGELEASLRALYHDARLAGEAGAVAPIRSHVKDLLAAILGSLDHNEWKTEQIAVAIRQIDTDISQLAEAGAPISLTLRLRTEISNVTRTVNRMRTIIRTSFIPAAYAIAEMAIGIVLLVLLISRMDPWYEGVVLLGGVAFIFISVLFLIKDMDNPFEVHDKNACADVDISLLRELNQRLEEKAKP